MASEQSYAEMIKEAEAAVAPVKDPELKRIAFEKILDSLLAKGSSETASGLEKSPPRSRSPKSARKAPERRAGGPQGYIDELIDEAFFKSPKTLASVRAELGNRGHHIPMTHLSKPMQRLCQQRRLRRQKSVQGNKEVYTYSNW
jgi:hypothetical protein